MSKIVNILKIIRGTTVDGPGFRTSIYFAGCRHECPGCHNPQSWDFNTGEAMTVDEILDVVAEEDFDVTLTGGDPLYSPAIVISIADKVHILGHNVWLYTGFTWEEIIADSVLLEAVSHVDVIVDSPFLIARRDTDLLFKGSDNQRIIDVPKSLEEKQIILWSRE